MWGALIGDLWKNFLNFGKNVKKLFKGIWKGMKGDFKGAIDEFGQLKESSYQATQSQLANMKDVGEGIKFALKEGFGEAKTAWTDFATLEGSDKVIEEFGTLGSNIKENVGGAIEEGTAKAGEAFDKLSAKVEDFKQKTGDAMVETGKKIADLQAKMQEAITGKKQSEKDIRVERAKSYLEQEEKVQKALLDMAHEDDAFKKQELRRQWEQEKKALDEAKEYEKLYLVELQEERRLAGLTEFERVNEELTMKLMSVWQEFEEKKKKINEEMELERNKYAVMQEIAERGLQEADKINAQREIMTKDSINREIAYYNELAKAISRAKSGGTSGSIGLKYGTNERASQTINKININVSTNNEKKVAQAVVKGVQQSNLVSAY